MQSVKRLRIPLDRLWAVGQAAAVTLAPGCDANVGYHLIAFGTQPPDRQSRRNHGKSDPFDAIEAARAAISGRGRRCGQSRLERPRWDS